MILREDLPGAEQLVAYIVGKNGSNTVVKLEEFLEMRLPGYMVPGAYVRMESLPITPNGKIDREMLPAPELDTGVEFAEPQSPLEAKLAEMWGELLGLDEISTNANFFDLGGNSLLGATFINRLKGEMAENVGLVTIFEMPTISSLGRYLADNYPVGVRKLLGYGIDINLDGTLVIQPVPREGQNSVILCAAAAVVHGPIRTRWIHLQYA